MLIRAIFLSLFFSALCLASIVETQAQGSQSTEKAALIKELIALTGSNDNAEAIMNSIVSQVQSDRQRMFEQALEGMDFLSKNERRDLVSKENEDAKRINDRVMKLIKEQIDIKKVTDEVSFEVMDKYYTDDELKDLVAFYKTSTGQKSIKVLPLIFADSMVKTGEKLNPQLLAIMSQIMQEERERIEKLMPPRPQRKTTGRRKRR